MNRTPIDVRYALWGPATYGRTGHSLVRIGKDWLGSLACFVRNKAGFFAFSSPLDDDNHFQRNPLFAWFDGELATTEDLMFHYDWNIEGPTQVCY